MAEIGKRPTTVISLSAKHRRLRSSQTTKFAEDGSPVACPLDTLDQVLSWCPGRDELCVPLVPLRSRPTTSPMHDPAAPKMLVCHDMMGGYNMDKFVEGHRTIEDYYFYHWQYIGAFVYFSHHFITIPPPTWTNAAHRHGVLSMGTIITEWEDGARLCQRLLSDEVTVVQFCQQLVAIAQYYQMDGWLVNIENPIHPALVANLHLLLSLLTSGMHDACPGSKVIWYDSVTEEGSLKWQNELNQLNRGFFGQCDGIFLNYGWSMAGLQASHDRAEGRNGEVYVGVDVFGRGCFGGGGFNTHLALEVIKGCNLSAAVFAPGWVFETQDKTRFFENQDRFWSLLSHHCTTSAFQTLPLVSSFGRGCGMKIAVDGKVVFAGEWTNLSAQDLQPSFTTDMIHNSPESSVKLRDVWVNMSAGYNNGARLEIRGIARGTGGRPAQVRLFKTDFSLKEPLLLSYTVKENSTERRLSSRAQPPVGVRHFLQLYLTGGRGHSTLVFLDPHSMATPDEGEEEKLLPGCRLPRSRSLPSPAFCGPSDLVLAPLPPPYCRKLHQHFTGSGDQAEGWTTCYFLLQHDELLSSSVKEIGIAVSGPVEDPASQTIYGNFTVAIGEIKIIGLSSTPLTIPPSTITHLQCQDIDCNQEENTVSLTLKWNISNINPDDPVDHCNIYCSSVIGDLRNEDTCWKGEYVFLGRAHSTCFRVIGLFLLSANLQESPFSLEFRVQPVTLSRRKPPVEDSNCLLARITE